MTVLDACWNELSSLSAVLSWSSFLGRLTVLDAAAAEGLDGAVLSWSCGFCFLGEGEISFGVTFTGLKDPLGLLGVLGALVAATSGTS